jgi:hypothetical protein
LAPADAEVRVYNPSKLVRCTRVKNIDLREILNSPMTEAYKACLTFARTPAFASVAVTREEYLEHGKNIFRRRKFQRWNALNQEAAAQPPGKRQVESDSESTEEDPKTSRKGSAVVRRGPARRGRGKGRGKP